jgi:amidase
MSTPTALEGHDALDLADLVRRREVSPSELVEACIANVERLNPKLNAVVTPMFDEARDAAKGELPDGPFRGVPFFVKDLAQAVANVRFTRGSRFAAAEVPRHDSTLVRRYRRAGLVLCGKTNTPELGLTPYTEPTLHGTTHNPWSLAHNTGGSSGGAGAIVGARIAPMAHGGDGGGSIRIPASACGVFGLKPTRGRTPLGPDAGESWFGLALDHALTLSVRDSAALLDATDGYESGAPCDAPPKAGPFLAETTRAPGALRIALCKTPVLPGTPHGDVLAAADDAAKLCASLGHHVEERELPIDRDELALDFTTLIAVATACDIDDLARVVGRTPTHRDFETATWVVGLLGRTMGGTQLEGARRRMQALARRIAKLQEDFDVILHPTLGAPPSLIGSLAPRGVEARAQELIAAAGLKSVLRVDALVEAIAKKTFAFIPYTPLANVTGQPSMSVPLFWNAAGLPIGVMFTGRFGDEATLFRLAAQLEQARPWKDRRPSICAAG